MTKQQHPSIELYFQEGSSDKVYRAAIEPLGYGFVVNFAYGRRGATLTAGTKTQKPVSYNEAVAIYTKLVKSKTAKGYQPVADETDTAGGTGMVMADCVREDTGLRAQLLNPITTLRDVGHYLRHHFWCAQEKHDGRRLLVKKTGTDLIFANRRGQSCGCPLPVRDALAKLPGDFVIDGECVGDKYYAFDLLEHDGNDMRPKPYMDRATALCEMLPGSDQTVTMVDTALDTREKRDMFKQLQANGREGIVFKDLRAAWHAGHAAGDGFAIKFKFWQTCSCIVSAVNAKRSVALELGGKNIGNVTIPPSHDIPEPGQVVEIKYLYITGQGGSLYQPVYLGVRDDVDPDECTPQAQHLKYKAA